MFSIFTPLYFDTSPDSGSLYPSAMTKTSEQRILAYLDCALCMFWSARTHYPEARLIFIVNDGSMVGPLYRSLLENMKVEIVEVEPRSVPIASVRFRGAFFKLDAISYIAKRGSEFNIMLDNDAIFTKRDETLDFFIARRCNLAYSISKPGYIFESKAYLHEMFGKLTDEEAPVNCEWVGGEFVAGTPNYFADIDRLVKKSIDNYWKIHSTFHHIGDEVLLSCAISTIWSRDTGNVILNPHVIHRYWTRGVVGYGQLHYTLLSEIPILHLPDQKLYGFRRLGNIIKDQPGIKIDRNKLARIMGFSPWCKEALLRNPVAMLRRTLPNTFHRVTAQFRKYKLSY